MSRITYIEKNPVSGALTIYGNIGKRTFIGYSVKEARAKYIKYCKKWEEEDRKADRYMKISRETKGMSIFERIEYAQRNGLLCNPVK
jgi:hypothetical protein